MLGDGHIVKRSPSGNSRLVYAQTSVTHKEYFHYVYNFFKPLCVSDYIPSLEQLRTIGLKKHIVLYLSQLCNSLVLMYIEKCFIF